MAILNDDGWTLRLSDCRGQRRRRFTCRQRGVISADILDAAYPAAVPFLRFTSSIGAGFSPGHGHVSCR
jgi:hypothetical protein